MTANIVEVNNVKLNNLINELNFAQKLEKNIFDVFSNYSIGDNKVNHAEIYSINQQVFYCSLWCWYEVDEIVQRVSNWSSMESEYFLKLQSYLRKLLKISKLLPSVTYLFWQHSLRKISDLDLRHELSIILPNYIDAHHQASEVLANIKSIS